MMKVKSAVQWNWPNPESAFWMENPVPNIRPTSYMEVYTLLGTNGCSNDETMWEWHVCGVVETKLGKQVIAPGQWLVEFENGALLVLTEKQMEHYHANAKTL